MQTIWLAYFNSLSSLILLYQPSKEYAFLAMLYFVYKQIYDLVKLTLYYM